MDSSFPLLSILIANYNNGAYLQEAIDSIFRQKYNHWEIVIVDDGSTDDSCVVYEKYRNDSRFHILMNGTNRGVGFTKRRCVENAHGELCAFLDPDDVFFGDDSFDMMVRYHADHPEASMVYSGLYRADEHLNILKESPGIDIVEGSSALEMKSWPYHPFLTFKMSAYLKTEGIDPFMKNAEDYDLYYKLEEVGKTIHINAIQYIQRNNPHSISLNDNAFKASAWHTYACIKAMRRRGIEDESLMLFPMEHALQKSYLRGYGKATASRVYRLGRIVASPIIFISHLWKK